MFNGPLAQRVSSAPESDEATTSRAWMSERVCTSIAPSSLFSTKRVEEDSDATEKRNDTDNGADHARGETLEKAAALRRHVMLTS